MSLDIHLYGETSMVRCMCINCDNEHMREERECLFESNLTHNLNEMAAVANVYQALWRPEEIPAETARHLVPLLRNGLEWLLDNADEARTYNPANGWGDYKDLVRVVRAYLAACEQNPDATVRVSR